jgi:hypothetical protein
VRYPKLCSNPKMFWNMTPKRLRQLVLCAVVAAVAVGTILWLRPAAPRYKGKTVAEYLDTAGEDPVPDEVVQAFGMAALPEISASCRHSKIAFILAPYLAHIGRPRTAQGQIKQSHRESVAYMWLYNLRTHGFPVISRLADQRDRLNLFRQLTQCQDDLPGYAAQTTNLFLRDEAMRILSQKSTNNFRISAADMVTFP